MAVISLISQHHWAEGRTLERNRFFKKSDLTHHPITPSPHHPITPSPHHPITPSPWAVENVGFQVMSILPSFVARTAGKGFLASACVSIAVSGQGVAGTRF